MQTILPPSGNTIKILGQGSACRTRSALDDIRSGAAGRGWSAGVPHPDTGAAAAHAGRIRRTGHTCLNCGTAGFAYRRRWTTRNMPTRCVLSAARCRRNRSIQPLIPSLPPRTATPGAFTAMRWGVPVFP